MNAIGKLIEPMVEVQLRSYVEKGNFLPMSQHGLQKKRSTVTCLLSILDKLQHCLERKKLVGCLLFDLTAVFDMLSKDILTKKIKLVGLGASIVGWVDSFLSNRRQTVHVGFNASMEK